MNKFTLHINEAKQYCNAETEEVLTLTQEDNCSICTDPFFEKDVLFCTPCNHTFHKHCLILALYERPNHCPLCSQKVHDPVASELHQQMGVERDMRRDILLHIFGNVDMIHRRQPPRMWWLQSIVFATFFTFSLSFLFFMLIIVILVAEKEMMMHDFENITEMCPLKRWIP